MFDFSFGIIGALGLLISFFMNIKGNKKGKETQKKLKGATAN